ncbi:non-ribosomal peptide synthetase [Naviculisporaceae sp. PSN 640]
MSTLLPRPASTRKDKVFSPSSHPLLGTPIVDPLGLGIIWKNSLDASKLLALVDHPTPLPAVFPAAGYIKIVTAAAVKFLGPSVLHNFELDDFHVQNEINLNEYDKVQLILELQSTGSHERHGDRTDFVNFRIRSCSSNGNTSSPTLNALGCFRLRSSEAPKSLSLEIARPLPQHAETSLPASDTSATVIKTLPMSYAQAGFWFMTQLIDDPTFFNGTVSFLISNITLDIPHLAQVVLDMAQAHHGLRTAFFADPKTHEPVQAVLASSPLRLETKTITSPSQIREEIDAMNRHVYDISKGETLRLLLLTESPTVNHLIVGYHHINIDGMSIIALTDHLRLSYQSPAPLPPPFQHSEFAILQRERLQSGQYASDIAYWKAEFENPSLPDILPIIPLSPSTATKCRPSHRTTYRHVRAERRLSSSTTSALHALRKAGKVQSPFIFYTTVFQILLARLAQTDDLVIGLASANRHNDPSSTNSIGIFLNLVALRLRASMDSSFSSLLKQNKAKIVQGLKHSSIPIDVVLEEVNAPRHPSYNPLFQAFVNYIPVPETRSFGVGDEVGVLQNKEYEIGETMYDIMLAVIDPPAGTGNPWVAIMVQKELYTEREAKTLLDCFVNLVEAFVHDVDLSGNGPQMFNQADVARAVELGRGERLDFGGSLGVGTGLGSILGRLDEISDKNLDMAALRDTQGNVVTYRDMMAKSTQIAASLSASCVSPKARIGVLQEPTVDWVCSMLGIWRFGGSYVPLEITQGVGRLRSIVQDAELAAILVHDATRGLCNEIGVASNTVVLDVDSLTDKDTDAAQFYQAVSDDEAIVLYTSGSTGVPKGISLPHRMVTNTILGYLHSSPMTPQTVLQQIALSFDVSWWQTLIGLATGGSVIVAGKEVRRDPFALTALIVSMGITLTLAVPSEAASWLQNGDLNDLRGSAWEWHISAGEEIGVNLIEGLRALGKSDSRFVNAYGPAETIIPHAYEIPYRDIALNQPIPIGKVLPNYNVYIMDKNGHPLPAGVPGQIVIGGAGVASGYLKQPELTAARFPQDPLADPRAVANGWTRCHLSGDRGYIDDTGVFVALGRMNGDTQVKLRGQRFELREVESALLAAGRGDISEAVCHVRRRDEKDAGSAFLVAHVVLGPDAIKRYGATAGPTVDKMLRQIVSKLELPQYMRPSVVVPLPAMPLSHHGKVDRKRLAQSPLRDLPQIQGTKAQPPQKIKYSPPLPNQNLREGSRSIIPGTLPKAPLRLIEDIWRSVLGDLLQPDQNLDHDSDFFLVGGSSLLLINVKAKIRDTTGYDVPLAKLFEGSTLGKMADILGNIHDNAQPWQQGGAERPIVRHNAEGYDIGAREKMKRIWLLVLGDVVASEQDIGPESDFFLVGGSSLLLISVQREINKQFGLLLPLAKLFETSTLAQMSALLETSLAAAHSIGSTGKSGSDVVNWQDEVAFKDQVPASFTAAIGRSYAPDGIAVVLTGATGFLGRHMLQRLVDNPKVAAVHCVAIRDASKLGPLASSSKVVIHQGDLRDPQLGLSEDSSKRIFSGLCAIIHNGADVSFLRGYRTVRAANVVSTKTLVKLSIKYHQNDRPPPCFHFVSTAGVSQLGTSELYEESLPVPQPPENSNGYVASKWASEKYLENAHIGSGIPVAIHRPSYILGPDAPQLDVMHNLLHFASKLRSVPIMPPVDRWLQFVDINEVAGDIVGDVLMSLRSGQRNALYRNHCGHEKDWVRLDQLGPYLEKHEGGSFKEVAFQDWTNAAGRAGMPVQVKEYLSNLMMDHSHDRRSWVYPRVLKGVKHGHGHGPWRRTGRL